jgi:capsular exopolysaccharide synthesis family protein
MKFLKTLQKKQSERRSEIDVVDNVVTQEAREKNGDNKPPELFVERDLKIGTPKTAFNNQHDSSSDTAHSDFEPTSIGLGDLDNTQPNEEEEKLLPRITLDSALVNPHLVSITQPNSPYCEEYRSLRTEVLHKSQKQKLQSVVIASVGPSEGKSVTAINLAWLLAQTSDVSALIIDSDLRMPSLTDYLGIEVETGLSEVLEGTSSLTNSIVRLEPVGLYLLPGGRARNDVSELISGTKFKEILRDAYEMFNYVIIDAPPLGIFTDGTVLINQADGAILVVRANHTNYRNIERVLEVLPRQKMLGAVLNQSEDTLIRESYYNYDYYRKTNTNS